MRRALDRVGRIKGEKMKNLCQFLGFTSDSARSRATQKRLLTPFPPLRCFMAGDPGPMGVVEIGKKGS